MKDEVTVLSGGKSGDSFSAINFVNDFKFNKVKRFYHIEVKRKNYIKAFHGHMIEEKYAYVAKGKFLLVAVKLSDTKKPAKKTEIKKIILSSKKPQIVHIPAGYANGYKSLQNNSSIIFFSTLSLEDSQKDDYRFDKNYWGNAIWNEMK